MHYEPEENKTPSANRKNVGNIISAFRWWDFKGMVAQVWIIFTAEWPVILLHPVINVVTILVTHWALVSDRGRVMCMEVHLCLHQSLNRNFSHWIWFLHQNLNFWIRFTAFLFSAYWKLWTQERQNENVLWNSSSCCTSYGGIMHLLMVDPHLANRGTWHLL